ncbi:hypothetical protein RQP46_005512 [Phenoliferia psychrophenolica]
MSQGARKSKLRMKDTPEDIEVILKAERRARKKRRREEERHRDNDSMTPPRAGAPQTFADDVGFDESSLPPGQAIKPEVWVDKLMDAAETDAGPGYYEDLMYSRETAAAFSYGGAAGIAMGVGGKSGLDALDEEEYAEHVRAGMWRRKNKDEAERIEAMEKARKLKQEKEQVENEKRQRVERDKIRKLEEKAKQRNKRDEQEARERYDSAWKKLQAPPRARPPPATAEPPPASTDPAAATSDDPASTTTPPVAAPQFYPLRYTDFPWPLYSNVPYPPLSWPTAADITATAISSFLLAHLEPAAKKAALRAAVLAYHPDRFDRLVTRIPEEKEDVRERVKELGLRVSQVLNDLLKAAAG